MRAGASAFFAKWSDPTFQPVGDNRPRGVVTVEPDWKVNPKSSGLGSWPSKKRPVRWWQRGSNAQTEHEIPNIKNVSMEWSVDQDAGTCTITLANQWMKTNFAAALANELGMPGYFTHNHGASGEARARWNHQTNAWRNRLVPGALIRVFQGYGGWGKSAQQAISDGDLMLTGVWIVDEVTIGAKSKLIELRCRDMGALLIDQLLYPPLVPPGLYPLDYARWRTEQRQPSAPPGQDDSSDAPYWLGAEALIDKDTEEREGYWTISNLGHLDAFGDGRIWARSGGSVTAGRYRVIVANPEANGFWTMTEEGRIASYGQAPYLGDPYSNGFRSTRVTERYNVCVDLAPTPDGQGYWVLTTRGWIYSFGNAANHANISVPGFSNVRAISLEANPTGSGFWAMDTNGRVTVRGSATHFGDFDAVVLDDQWPGFTTEVARKLRATRSGDGYWMLTSTGRVQTKGAAQHFGDEQTAIVPEDLNRSSWNMIMPSPTGNGYGLMRGDGTIVSKGDFVNYGSPASVVFRRVEGNYTDYTQIIRDILLWSGFHLEGVIGTGNMPAVYGNLESTGIFSPSPLPPEMFDKKAPIEPIKELKEIVGFIFRVSPTGAVHFESPNMWSAGNWLETGEHTAFIPEVDDRVQLTDYTSKFTRDKDRSEIIIATDEPTLGFKDTVVTRHRPSNSLLRGMTVPMFVRVPPEVSKAEQEVMAELVSLHLWFARRAGQVTILANPAIELDDQIRLFERVTGETFIHWVRGISSEHDFQSGKWTMDLTTNWLGTEDGTWAITKSGALASSFVATSPSSDTFVISSKLDEYLRNHSRQGMSDPSVIVSPDLDA